MTLNYRVMVEGYPNLKEEVGGSNPGCEISSLLDGKLARWLIASCAWRWPVGLLSQKKKKKLSLICEWEENPRVQNVSDSDIWSMEYVYNLGVKAF